MLEQHAERLGLDRVLVNCQEVIAEGALLFVTDPVGYRLAIHRTASCAVTVADASAAQRREHGAGSAETMG